MEDQGEELSWGTRRRVKLGDQGGGVELVDQWGRILKTDKRENRKTREGKRKVMGIILTRERKKEERRKNRDE